MQFANITKFPSAVTSTPPSTAATARHHIQAETGPNSIPGLAKSNAVYILLLPLLVLNSCCFDDTVIVIRSDFDYDYGYDYL